MNGGIVWRYVSEDRHVRCIVNKIKLVAYQRIPRHCDTRWRDGVYYSTVIIFFFLYFNHESTRACPFIPLHRKCKVVGRVALPVAFTKLRRGKNPRRAEFDDLSLVSPLVRNLMWRYERAFPLLFYLKTFKDASSLISIIFFECRKIFDDDFMLQL